MDIRVWYCIRCLSIYTRLVFKLTPPPTTTTKAGPGNILKKEPASGISLWHHVHCRCTQNADSFISLKAATGVDSAAQEKMKEETEDGNGVEAGSVGMGREWSGGEGRGDHLLLRRRNPGCGSSWEL